MMTYYILRRFIRNNDPLALFRINGNRNTGMCIFPQPSINRFGPYVRITRKGRHIYNLMLEDHKDIINALTESDFVLEEISQAEWESWNFMELIPKLKTAVAQ